MGPVGYRVRGAVDDVALSELTLECFFPADADTRDALRQMSEARG